jgi:MscS family membrane protein
MCQIAKKLEFTKVRAVHVMYCGIVLMLIMLISSSVLAQPEQPTVKDVIEETPAEQQTKPADETPPAPPATRRLGPADDFDRGVPRTSLLGFLDAAGRADFERAANYLDLRYLPYGVGPEQGPELARQLNIVLDRALWIDPELLSTDPEGYADDGAHSSRDMIGTVQVGERKIDLLLQRVPREDGVLIWKISNATVNRIPELYAEYGYGRVGEKLAKLLPSGEFLGLQLWQWLMGFGLLIAAYFIAYVPTKIAAILINRRETELSAKVAKFVSGPLRLLSAVILARTQVDLIHPSMKARTIMEGQTLAIIVICWACIIFIGLLRDFFVIRLRKKGSTAGVVLIRPITRIVQVLVVVIAVMVWVENLGFRATSLLAGLGIGGLAVALAAQKSIENVIGAITLIGSAPVKIGDFGRFGDKLGTVEEIGLRYTNIRTLDRTIVHIPNAIFADMKLENFTDREKIWYHPVIKLSRKTSPNQIRYILVEVRKLLYSHPGVDPDPARVRFIGFGADSLDIDIFAYILRTDYSEYLEVAEDLHLRIMDIISKAGTELALPVQNVWFENTQPTDKQLKDAAEKQVRQWRQDNNLCIPKFPPDKIQELGGSLDYPPEGSATKTPDSD